MRVWEPTEWVPPRPGTRSGWLPGGGLPKLGSKGRGAWGGPKEEGQRFGVWKGMCKCPDKKVRDEARRRTPEGSDMS